MASAMETEAAVDRRLNMSLDDLIKTSSDGRSKGRGGTGGKRGNQGGKGGEGRDAKDTSNSGAGKAGKRGRSRGGTAAAGRSEIIVMDMGPSTKRGARGKNSARNAMAVKHVAFKGRPAKSVQAVKISTKRDGTVVHKVLKQRGGRIARQNQGNLGGLGNSIPLSLLPDGIQAPKLAGYDATPRQGNVRRRNSQHSQQVAANEGGNTIRAVPLQLGRGSGATPSRNGRGSGGRGGPMAMASESRESVPREVPNVRVTFQNTRPLNGSGPVSSRRRGGGVLFPGGGW